MGKSQETFNKKEKEKLRLKKRQDKNNKKEERKANAGSGSLDDMIAYVDENGHISSTPPDPKKKNVIKSEDIQIGIMRQEDMEPIDPIRKGTVTFYNDQKGYGFIKDHDSQESIFVHVHGLIDEISEGTKVTFETEMGQKGPNAVRVKLLVVEKVQEVVEVKEINEEKVD
jgi:cold shock CspA family protein